MGTSNNTAQTLASRWSLLAGGLVFAAVLLAANPGRAQQTGGDVYAKGGCADCHGVVADGANDPAYPQGPNLRRTRMAKEDLRETIACGRTGTAMPFHLADAYTRAPCYGMPVGAVPPDTKKGGSLTPAELDLLAEFLATSVLGQARVTKANCALFVGGNPNSPSCAQYPN